jgi:hypothetical protein
MESYISEFKSLMVVSLIYLGFILIKRCSHKGEEADIFTSLPVIGLQTGRMAWAKATMRSVFNTKLWAFEGYDKVSHA